MAGKSYRKRSVSLPAELVERGEVAVARGDYPSLSAWMAAQIAKADTFSHLPDALDHWQMLGGSHPEEVAAIRAELGLDKHANSPAA